MKKLFFALLITILMVFSLPCADVSAEDAIIWQRYDEGIRDFNFRTIAIDPQRPTIIYAGTDEEKGLYVGFSIGASGTSKLYVPMLYKE